MLKELQRYLRQKKGSVAIEFALSVPVLMVLLLFSFDMANLIWMHLRVERFANLLATSVSFPGVTRTDVDNVFSRINSFALPLELSTVGKSTVIVTHISNTALNDDKRFTQVTWRKQTNSYFPSKIGLSNVITQNISTNFGLYQDQQAIVAEVYHDYQPVLKSSFLRSLYQIYKIAVVPVRGESLSNLY